MLFTCMSEDAPVGVKTLLAFLMFDADENGNLGKQDLQALVFDMLFTYGGADEKRNGEQAEIDKLTHNSTRATDANGVVRYGTFKNRDLAAAIRKVGFSPEEIDVLCREYKRQEKENQKRDWKRKGLDPALITPLVSTDITKILARQSMGGAALKKLMKNRWSVFGLHQREVAAIVGDSVLRELDVDNNGSIAYQEFQRLVADDEDFVHNMTLKVPQVSKVEEHLAILDIVMHLKVSADRCLHNPPFVMEGAHSEYVTLCEAIRLGKKLRKKSSDIREGLEECMEMKVTIDKWYKKKGQLFVKEERLVMEGKKRARKKLIADMKTETCHRITPNHQKFPATTWSHGAVWQLEEFVPEATGDDLDDILSEELEKIDADLEKDDPHDLPYDLSQCLDPNDNAINPKDPLLNPSAQAYETIQVEVEMQLLAEEITEREAEVDRRHKECEKRANARRKEMKKREQHNHKMTRTKKLDKLIPEETPWETEDPDDPALYFGNKEDAPEDTPDYFGTFTPTANGSNLLDPYQMHMEWQPKQVPVPLDEEEKHRRMDEIHVREKEVARREKARKNEDERRDKAWRRMIKDAQKLRDEATKEARLRRVEWDTQLSKEEEDAKLQSKNKQRDIITAQVEGGSSNMLFHFKMGTVVVLKGLGTEEDGLECKVEEYMKRGKTYKVRDEIMNKTYQYAIENLEPKDWKSLTGQMVRVAACFAIVTILHPCSCC